MLNFNQALAVRYKLLRLYASEIASKISDVYKAKTIRQYFEPSIKNEKALHTRVQGVASIKELFERFVDDTFRASENTRLIIASAKDVGIKVQRGIVTQDDLNILGVKAAQLLTYLDFEPTGIRAPQVVECLDFVLSIYAAGFYYTNRKDVVTRELNTITSVLRGEDNIQHKFRKICNLSVLREHHQVALRSFVPTTYALADYLNKNFKSEQENTRLASEIKSFVPLRYHHDLDIYTPYDILTPHLILMESSGIRGDEGTIEEVEIFCKMFGDTREINDAIWGFILQALGRAWLENGLFHDRTSDMDKGIEYLLEAEKSNDKAVFSILHNEASTNKCLVRAAEEVTNTDLDWEHYVKKGRKTTTRKVVLEGTTLKRQSKFFIDRRDGKPPP